MRVLARDGRLYVPPSRRPGRRSRPPTRKWRLIALEPHGAFPQRADRRRGRYAASASRPAAGAVDRRPGAGAVPQPRRWPSRTWPCRCCRADPHVLAGARVTIAAATSGDTGGAAIEALQERVDVMVLFPQGRISDVQRRMMRPPRRPTCTPSPSRAHLQALVKAMFNDLAFRDRVQLAAVNSINWGRQWSPLTYYFVAGAALGSPSRPMLFSVPTGNFRRRVRGLVRQGHRPAGGAAGDHRHQRERHPHRAWSTGMYLAVGRSRDHLPLDGHPRESPPTSSASFSRPPGANLFGTGQDERVAPKPVDRPRRGDGALPRGLHQNAVADCGPAGAGALSRPPQRVRGRCRAQDTNAQTRRVPNRTSHSPPRIPRNSPTPSPRSPANAQPCRRGLHH